MKCPFCSHMETKVVDKRDSEEDANRRRRECLSCGKRFTTYEKVEVNSKKVDKIKKRDGRIADFDAERIVSAVFKAAKAVGGTDKELAKKLASEVVDQVNKKFVGKKDIPTVEFVQDIVEKVLIENGHAKTAKAYIIYRQERAELRSEKKRILEKDSLDEVDKKFDLNALRVLKSRYLRKDSAGKLIETPKQLFTRVATHGALPDVLHDQSLYDINRQQQMHPNEDFDPVTSHEKYKVGKYSLNQYHLDAVKRMYDRFNKNKQMKVSWSQFLDSLSRGSYDNYEKNINEFYGIMTNRQFIPNTPAIANFGAVLGMGSACYVLGIDDSIDDIMEKLKCAALIFKSGGGVGYNFSNLRPEGDMVSSTCGLASGPLSFMSMFDKMTEVIKQGGCVSTDTIVRTDKGLVPMLNMLNSPPLKENPTEYFVYDGKEYNHAWLAQNNGMAQVYTIETELGNGLKATGNHLMAVATEQGIDWKRVDQIQEGDWLVTVLGGHQGKKIKLPPIGKQHHNSAPLKLPKYLNEELAELLGLYVADGCFSGGRLIFSVDAKDKDLISRIEYLTKSVFGLEIGEKRNNETYYDLVFSSKDLEKYFAKLGWKKNRSWDAFVPEDILQSDENVVHAFLRGLFEGDGTRHPDGYPILTSSSKLLIDQMQQLLLSVGILAKTHKIKKDGKQMYKIETLKNKINTSDNKFFNRVTKISNGLEAYTMEIEVPATSSYIGNSFLVHNIRRGANMGIMNSNHPDIEKFITAKAGNKAFRNFNISVNIQPDFWQYYEKNEPYPLLNPKDGKVIKMVNPRSLFDKIVYQAWESAEPGVIFSDKVNEHNPLFESLGPIETTNPCVTGDTIVPTENGFITIKELAEKYPNGGIGIAVDKRVQNNDVLLRGLLYVSEFSAFKTGKKETIKLITETGKQLKCTPDHRILTTNGWKNAETLKKEDEILVDSEDGIDKLDKIEPNGIEDVYDITEPLTHSFIANGIVVHNCGEVLLYPDESCNLGSINVWAFVKEDVDGNTSFDWESLAKVSRLGEKFLDNVVEVNKWPLEAIEQMGLNTRKTGLGIMGIADLLYELGLPYNDNEGRDFMERITEFINYHSKLEAVELSRTRGPFLYYDKSFYKDGKLPFAGFYDKKSWKLDWNVVVDGIKKHGIRNAFTIVIAPTGSISMIAGCSSGIEPVYSLVFEKNVKVGSFYYVNPIFEKCMRREGLFDEKLVEDVNTNKGTVRKVGYIPTKLKKVFTTAMDTTPEDHIRALAAVQKWVDSSISKTNNFPADATVEHMRDSYLLAYNLGCKDVTVFRDSSIKDQVLVSGVKKSDKHKADTGLKPQLGEPAVAVAASNGSQTLNFGEKPKNCPSCETPTDRKEGCVSCPSCGWGMCD